MRRRPSAMQPLCWWQPERRLGVVKHSPVSGGVVEAFWEPLATPVLKTNTWLSHQLWGLHVYLLDFFVIFLLDRVAFVLRGCYAPTLYLELNEYYHS